MTLPIEKPEADRLAREVASLAGEMVAAGSERRRRLTELSARARAQARAEGVEAADTRGARRDRGLQRSRLLRPILVNTSVLAAAVATRGEERFQAP